MRHFLLFLQLARTSNLPTVWTNALAAWALSGFPLDWRCILLASAGSLLYAGGCTLNDAFDAAWDRKHRPERPIPSGDLSSRAVWIVGMGEMAAGVALLGWFNSQAVFSGLLLAAAILLYDWLHKKSAWTVLLMGWCRLQWILTCAAAVLGSAIPVMILFHAAGLMLYIVGLSLVARRESRKVGRNAEGSAAFALDPARLLPLAPIVLLAMLRPEPGKVPAVIAAVFLFAGWVKVSEGLFLRKIPPLIGGYVARLLAGIVLLDTLFAAIAWGWTAFLFIAFLPVCLLLQMRFAAT